MKKGKRWLSVWMIVVLIFSNFNFTLVASATEPQDEMIEINSDWNGSVMGDTGTNDLNVENFSIMEHETGDVTLRASNDRGKISAATEGFVYYFKEIEPDVNFEFKATAHVESWTANNQVSFGLMLRSNVLHNERLASFTGNYLALGALDQEMKAYYKKGFKEGDELGVQTKDGYEFTLARQPQVNETYELTIRKVGNIYTLSVGNDTQIIEYDEALNYFGLYVARNATVTFSDVEFSIQPTIGTGDWEFEKFGSNTSDERNPEPTFHEDGSVTLFASGGKVASNDEGVSYLYKQLPADSNFEITTKATVNSFNTDSSISTPNQKSFGVMIRDQFEVGSATQSSNYVAVGALDTNEMKGFYKHSVTGTTPSTGTQIKLSPFDVRVPSAGEVYDLSIRKSGNVYVVTTNGQREVFVQEELFSETFFAGLYVARDAEVTFSNFEIKTDARIPTQLNANSTSMKTDYLIGENLDLNGLVVITTWSDSNGVERTETLSQNEYIVTGFDSSSAGPNTVTVHFNGLETSIDLMIASLSVEELEILYYPAKTTYYLGDRFDANGFVVQAIYNTGLKEELTPDDYTFSIPEATIVDEAYIFEHAGMIEVEVISTETPEKSVTFNVEVKDTKLQALEIDSLPEKTVYFIGDEIDLSGLVVYAKYDDGSSVRLLRDEFTVSALDTSAPSEQELTVAHKGVEVTFSVTVKEKELAKIKVTDYPKTTYYIGESFERSGLEVSKVYDNFDEEVLAEDLYDLDLSLFDNSEPGIYSIDIKPHDTSMPSTTLKVTVREVVEYDWEFIRFGQSIGTNRNIWEVIQDGKLEEQVIKLEASTGQNAGKITGDHDGITYYYTVIDANEDNFELSADIKVIHYAKTPHDGQESFGIMARDAIGQPDDSAVFSSNIAAVGGFAGRTIWPNGTQLFARTGVIAPDGEGSEDIQRVMLKEERPSLENTYPEQEYRLTLAKTNSGFVGKLNNEYEEIIFEPEILNVQDDNIYVGFYTAREATIEVHNIEFAVTAAATDAPKVERPLEQIKPEIEVLSLNKTPLINYDLKVRANVDGVLNVRQGGSGETEQILVQAGQVIDLPTTLNEKSNTTFSITLIPDDRQYLTSYNPVIQNFTVVHNTFADGHNIYISPEGNSQGDGTRSNPLDIDTAIDFVQPGQSIVALDGNYVRQSALHIKRYNDGTAEEMKYLVADEGARPVFDFDRSSDGMLHEGNYWHVSGLDFTNSAGNTKGYHLAGSDNVIEYSRFYNNGDSGFQMSRIDYSLTEMHEWPSNNLIQYSVAFDNMDPAQNNADGFAIKLTVGEGNILRGLVAHNNVDDGYDLYTKVGSGPIGVVLIEDSIAFNNGILTNGTGGGGDKNGFKLGGEGVHVPHILRNSLAFNNGKYGITSNSNPGLIIEDSIVYNNQEGNLHISTYDHITPDFTIDGIVSYQSERTGSAYRDRYPAEQTGENNFYFDGTKSTNSSSQTLTDDQFIISEPTLPLNPYDLPSIVNQKDENGNIVWGDFFKYLLSNEGSENPDLVWEAITFGQSTDLNFNSNVIPEKVGTNYAEPAVPGTIEDSIILESRGGKIAAGHDGLTFYYTTLDPNVHNFVLEADIYVEQFGPETAAGPSTQDSAGIMVRDVNGGARQDPMLPGFEEVPAASNIFGVGAVRVNGSNKEQVRVAPISRTGVLNPWGNFGSTFSMSPFSTNANHHANLDTPIRMKLERTDTSFILSTSYTTHTGETVHFEEEVEGADLVQVIDSNQMNLGFYAARNAKIRVENASITLSEANTVQSPIVEEPLANAAMNIVSAPQSGATDYNLKILANYKGTISITKDEQEVISQAEIEANDVFEYKAELENEITNFKVTYLPEGAPTDQPITREIAVTKQIFTSGEGLFVSPEGTSSGTGTIEDPLDFITAIQYVLPGETIFMRGGIYTPDSMIRISEEYSGEEGKRKQIVPYNGEKVVIDGQGSLNEILRLEADYWHLYGIELTRAAATSMRLKGDHNIIEMMTFSYNGNTGLHITGDGSDPNDWPKHNLVLNSTSHHNEDVSQIDADGFAAKLGVGEGNVFRGNIAHDNVDDGWDLYNRINEGPNMPVLLDGNIAYGNRNGFKVGGEGLPVAHIVKNNLAFHNSMDGFTDNFNPGALVIENNTSFDNERFNFIFRLNPYFSPEEQGTFKNNLSFRTNTADAVPDFISGNVDETNFFFDGTQSVNSNGEVVKEADFASLVEPEFYSRNEDGSIEWGDFLRLTVDSFLNTAGKDPAHVGALPAIEEEEKKEEDEKEEEKPGDEKKEDELEEEKKEDEKKEDKKGEDKKPVDKLPGKGQDEQSDDDVNAGGKNEGGSKENNDNKKGGTGKKVEEEQGLPNTATQHYQFLLYGILLMSMGILIHLFMKRKKNGRLDI
ncbi:hypothetical protein AJ85_09245 [Alkalihalobacillus alcalophilus ATCC 27647 = CGMCC 1.3604]|uniref:Uncharacterized protein n=1 Tax=Alkalihalobacillus alcalophilus ATCC 27647 = CGMCC 1.3604 TaxID=1218173 RepID=A0A4S4JZI3_ALKAL|nr:bacterial Ig-like domain-containing protein [Alkalihalobacillus alcalophilus]MED1561420.1 bacterial Ig-like domain-containing protein [Alkalihalobacillus alcalophilus]THG90694.1 hypothetical protein AJ85_09245 [Alkalihalobacillus alcalophilus ATCC 27647 = CGMCC 1.3604]